MTVEAQPPESERIKQGDLVQLASDPGPIKVVVGTEKTEWGELFVTTFMWEGQTFVNTWAEHALVKVGTCTNPEWLKSRRHTAMITMGFYPEDFGDQP